MVTQIAEGFRLSPQQKRLWFQQQQDNSAAFRAQCVVMLEGGLDTEALREAVRQVVARHEILRTTFQRQPGIRVPVQVISDADESFEKNAEGSASGLWQAVDLSASDAREQSTKIEELMAEEAARPFDFERGALLRLSLLTLSERRHALLLTLPALCADAGTLKYFVEELARSYGSLKGGAEFGAEPMQYADFAEWQHELLEAEDGERGRAFWREQSAAQLSPMSIPFETRASGAQEFAPQSFAPQRLTRVLDGTKASRLDGFAREHETRVEHVLQACWQTLLWRLTRQPEIVLGRICDGRRYEELEGAFGLLARCVPVGCRFDEGATFAEVLAQVESATREAEQWQEFWTGDERAAQSPYFAAGFEFQELGGAVDATSGVRFSVSEQFVCFERFKLKLGCAQSAQLDGDDDARGLRMEFQYDPQYVEAAAVECLAEEFEQLMESAFEAPRALVAELRMVSAGERERRLARANVTRRSDGGERCAPVHRLFEEQAARVPERVAVACEGNELSYAELNARANRLARHLRGLGVGRESVVALCVERSVGMMVGLLGILKAGGAYVPLDGAQPAQRLATILEETGAPVVVTQASLSEDFGASGARVVRLDADWELIARESAENLRADVDEATGDATSRETNEETNDETGGEHLAYVIFTSGSTGKPKGVGVEHRQLSNYVQAVGERIQFPEAASYAIVSTFAADLGHTMIFPAVCSGGTLHIIPQQRATDAAALAEYFTRHSIDCLKIVPSHLEALLAHTEPAALLPRRRLIVGGEASRRELIERVQELVPECEIYNHYGPTETTVGVLTHRFERGARGGAMLPLGEPLANVAVYVLDARMQLAATGETGEIYVGGASVARGYTSQPAPTAEKFVPDSLGAERGGRFYRTGDLGRYLPGGAIEFAGRADGQVKFHGYRIELNEIRCLLNQHPQISDSLVRLSHDASGREALVAYYVAAEELDGEGLRALLAESVIEQTIPGFFIHLKKFPLTPNGKIDTAALPTLEEARQSRARAFVAPRNALEELLAGMWAQMLGVSRVGAEDNFFALGGHSLLATRVISQLHKTLRVDVPLQILFEAPTVAGMAARLDELLRSGQGVQMPPIVRVERAAKGASLPLSFAQQRLWFIDQLEPNSSGFNSTGALRLSGTLNLKALERTLNEIVRRHEVLRTTFQTVEGRPAQVIDEPRPVALSVVELSGVAEAEREASALRYAEEDAAQPFDLSKGPLLRVALLRLDEAEHVLVLTMHHIISDAWSGGVLVREVSALYEAFLHQRPSPLAELPVQYADFAHWQQAWLRGDALEAQLAYWRERLGGQLPMTELPTDRPRPEVRSFHGAKHTVAIPKTLTDDLKTLSQREGATLFMTLLAAFQILLRFYSKGDDIIVGTDVANRNRAETDHLIGFFVNQLVLRTDLSGNPTFTELLTRVRETALGAYAHQDMPFDKLVEALNPERSLKYSPFFQVKLVLENTPVETLELPGLTLTPLAVESVAAKLDLTPLLRETPEGLQGWFEYNRDLFDAGTVAALAEQFEMLLRAVVAQPEARISELEAPLAEAEKRREQAVRERAAQEKRQREEAQRNSFKSFKSIKPKTVKLPQETLVTSSYLEPGEKLPLVLSPAADGLDLVDWTSANREFIEAELLRHGAILFRGFDVATSTRFEQFAAALCSDLFNENGEHPRTSIGGKVYTPVFYPPDKQLLWHNENSFNDRWPMKIWFHCVKPAATGGETPLVDSAKVFDRLDPRLRERFLEKRVMYVRNYEDGLGLNWQTVFQTEDRREVEERCRKAGMEFQWKERDRLRTRCVRPAAAKHPRTGAWVWFNQAQHWHVSCLDAGTRASIAALFAEEDFPRHCYYGDGTPIEDSVMDEICEVYRSLEVCFPWQAGDIVMLDNMLTAHGRNPFTGERKLGVAMGEMLRYTED